MKYDDVIRAVQWGLTASFLESKMDSSALVCLCQAMVDAKGLQEEGERLFLWALETGAQMKLLEANSGLFFQVASFPGALWVWRKMLDHGYPLERVVVQSKGALASGKTSRVSTKLGLLCCAPCCLSDELPELIELLIARGVDPNERDSDGYTPLGRLNEQLRHHEANSLSLNSFVPALVRGVQVLLDRGADIEGILPSAETFAAKSIQECIRAKKDRTELLQHVSIPEGLFGEVKSAPSRAL